MTWWEVQCEYQNGPILGYILRRHGSSPNPTDYVIHGEQTRDMNVTDNIKPGDHYLFSLAGFNGAGTGVFSPVIPVVTPTEE